MIGYIYQIENLITHESYIGQTIDYSRRIKTHINKLRGNRHDNPKLQNAWNKYGEQEFHFRKWEFEISSEEELNNLEIEYIKKFNSLNNGYNLVPGGGKPPNHQKINDEHIIDFLCVQKVFGDGYGKSFEAYYGWSNGVASSAKRKIRFFEANLRFEKMSEEEVQERAKNVFAKMKLDEYSIKRQLAQGGCETAYRLTQEDYNFAFCASELGYRVSQIAKYLGVKECTVYDWFNGRSRRKEKEKFNNLSTDEKNRLIGRVKIAELSGKPKSISSN